MTTTQSTQFARRWFDTIWTCRQIEESFKLMESRLEGSAEGGVVTGPEQFRDQVFIPLTTAFPDFQVEVLGTVAEEDQVVVRWMARGIHLGDGLGIKASQRKVEFSGMTWLQLREGKIVDGWDRYNLGGLLAYLADGTISPTVRCP